MISLQTTPTIGPRHQSLGGPRSYYFRFSLYYTMPLIRTYPSNIIINNIFLNNTIQDLNINRHQIKSE